VNILPTLRIPSALGSERNEHPRWSARPRVPLLIFFLFFSLPCKAATQDENDLCVPITFLPAFPFIFPLSHSSRFALLNIIYRQCYRHVATVCSQCTYFCSPFMRLHTLYPFLITGTSEVAATIQNYSRHTRQRVLMYKILPSWSPRKTSYHIVSVTVRSPLPI